ncbi:MAG: TfoX/Sxy family protein [Chloroflexota bacterium]
MAKEYFNKISTLVSDLNLENELDLPIEIKHFFSGAAFYVNGAICATWGPSGLAFKLPEAQVEQLIASGAAVPLQHFPKGHIKKGYACFENPDASNPDIWRGYFLKAAGGSKN